MSKKLPVAKPTGKLVKSVGGWLVAHQKPILSVSQKGLIIATPIVVYWRSRHISETIDYSKKMLDEAKSKEEKNHIYISTIKEIGPDIALIAGMIAAQMVISVQTDKIIKGQDKQIKNLEERLSVATNAIVAYQAFKKEAEEKLPNKKLQEVNDAVADKVLEQNKDAKVVQANIPTTASANQTFTYYDLWGNRFFDSLKAPSVIKEDIQKLSLKLCKGEAGNYDNDGRNRVTINDVYDAIDPGLKIYPAGDAWGWFDDDRGEVDENQINFDIDGRTDPRDPDRTVFYLDIMPAPLFRTRY